MATFDLENYVPTQVRIVQFWELHPNGAIRTNLMSDPTDFDQCRYVAKVYKEAANPEPDATGWAFEIAGGTGPNKTNHEENCETSAIGRALANLGFATSLEDRPSREEMSKVNRGNGEARPQPKSNYPPRADAPTAITKNAEQDDEEGTTPLGRLHGLAKRRGIQGKGKDVHTPLRCVCQYIMPTVRNKNGQGYSALSSMAQLTDENLEYLYRQIDEADDKALLLMAVDYPAAIKAAQDLDTLEQIRMDLTSIGARDHTHPDLLKAYKERRAALSPKLGAEVAA